MIGPEMKIEIEPSPEKSGWVAKITEPIESRLPGKTNKVTTSPIFVNGGATLAIEWVLHKIRLHYILSHPMGGLNVRKAGVEC